MKCSQYRRLFTAYFDGEIDEATWDRVRTHLMLCSACSIEFEGAKKAVKLLSDPAPVTEAEDMAARVRERIEEGIGSRARVAAPPRVWVSAPVLLRVAAAVLLFALGYLLAVVTMRPAPPPTLAAGEAEAQIAALQKFKLLFWQHGLSREVAAPLDEAQEALARAGDAAGTDRLRRLVGELHRAERLIAAGEVERAEMILRDLSVTFAGTPMADYLRITRLMAKAPSRDALDTVYALYKDVLFPEALLRPGELVAKARSLTSQWLAWPESALDLLPTSGDGGSGSE